MEFLELLFVDNRSGQLVDACLGFRKDLFTACWRYVLFRNIVLGKGYCFFEDIDLEGNSFDEWFHLCNHHTLMLDN